MDRNSEIRTAVHAALASVDGIRTSLDLVGEIPLLESIAADVASSRVAAARADGASWAAIAERLGVSRQAAHKRFGALGRLKRGRKIELELRIDGSKPK